MRARNPESSHLGMVGAEYDESTELAPGRVRGVWWESGPRLPRSAPFGSLAGEASHRAVDKHAGACHCRLRGTTSTGRNMEMLTPAAKKLTLLNHSLQKPP